MGLYYAKIHDTIHAKECFDFVINSSTKHGFLAEQVENSSMRVCLGNRACMVSCNVYNFARRINQIRSNLGGTKNEAVFIYIRKCNRRTSR
ncbi:MAG: hypothetical protein HFJ50_03175 [Clostridia bacterium]|nr:hypothetical protein [Clostridia bacterium]